MFFLILFTAVCSADAAPSADMNSADCAVCHKTHVTGKHKGLKCGDCHARSKKHYDKAADMKSGAKGCLKCHKEYGGIMHSHMVTRDKEKKYARDTFDSLDKNFFGKNCGSCHVQSCLSCHGGSESGHSIKKPTVRDCQTCHRGYFTGIEYTGLGQRDDHDRYQRGKEQDGEKYASMLKDVHAEKGMACGDCHSMRSLADGRRFSKTCTDCHKVKNTSVEHSVTEHMTKMECYTCHSSWADQEYGTFWIKFKNSSFTQFFRWVKRPNLEYAKSSHTKQYADFPIGVNVSGKYSPVRPQFLMFVTEIEGNKPKGKENRMMSDRFTAFFPHTVRRETVMCQSCHKNNRRLMRAGTHERIFLTDKDGLEINSFYNGKNFRVANGRFVSDAEYKRITGDTPEYVKKSLKKWEQISDMIRGGR